MTEEEAPKACMSVQRGTALNGGEGEHTHELECDECKSAMRGRREKPRWVGVGPRTSVRCASVATAALQSQPMAMVEGMEKKKQTRTAVSRR